ncbi:MAG TPA: YceI family protein [Vicinamibacterales bacterium]|nr:YceI family protein [Vicinamibacterales bacterium]
MRRSLVTAVAAAAFVAPILAQSAPTTQPPAGPAPAGQQPAAASQAQPQRPPQPPLGPNEWAIDGSHSAANFSVRHNVVSTVRGTLGAISGKIEYDGKDVTSVKADVSIDMTKIDTQNERRDNHLRSPDFFDVANHPHLTFRSKRVETAGAGRFKLVGDLTIRGNTKEVVLDVDGPAPTVQTAGRNGGVTLLTGASATTKISRKEFGVLWNNMIEAMPVVGDEVNITIDLELRRNAPVGK